MPDTLCAYCCNKYSRFAELEGLLHWQPAVRELEFVLSGYLHSLFAGHCETAGVYRSSIRWRALTGFSLQELTVVASLGVILLDLIRYFLFVDEQGLPLGLAGAKLKFNSIMYICSQTFWVGIHGFTSWRRRILVACLTISCCLLTTFIGPSSALLAIPVYRTNWPAGGTQFWLSGNESVLWPDVLDSSSVGGQDCLNPSASMIYSDLLNKTGCIWSWTSGLTQYAKDGHFDTHSYNITVYDGIAMRELQRRPSGDTWVLASMVNIAWMSSAISQRWLDVVLFATTNWTPLSSYSRYYFRERTGTVARVRSQIPAVRTDCGYYGPADFNSTDQFEVL
jgi:hypothetical protein